MQRQPDLGRHFSLAIPKFHLDYGQESFVTSRDTCNTGKRTVKRQTNGKRATSFHTTTWSTTFKDARHQWQHG